MSFPITCGLKIEGVDDELIDVLIKDLLDVDETKETIRGQVQFKEKGKIEIEGIGFDGRCRFCIRLKNDIKDLLLDRKSKGSITPINCPYAEEKRINFTPEIQIEKEKLISLFENKNNQRTLVDLPRI